MGSESCLNRVVGVNVTNLSELKSLTIIFSIFAYLLIIVVVMIQRIQTLFLAIAAGLLISMFFVPMVRFTGSDTTIPFVAVAMAKGFTLTTIFQIVCAVLSVVTIFTYKNRIRQIRLCNLNTLILISYQVILAIYFFQRNTKLGEDALFTVPCIFPICAAILTFIAMRYIARDEALVMASTRLRSASRGGKKRHGK